MFTCNSNALVTIKPIVSVVGHTLLVIFLAKCRCFCSCFSLSFSFKKKKGNGDVLVKEYKLPVMRITSSGDLTYNMVIIAKNAICCT